MRLVCPNCGAQYEVDDRVIPDSGRDVQCSSCGHAWYQMPAGADAGEGPEPAEPEEAIGADEDAAGFEAEPEPGVEPEAGTVEQAGAPESPAEAAAPEPQAEQPAREPAPEPTAPVGEAPQLPGAEAEAEADESAAGQEAGEDEADEEGEAEGEGATAGGAGPGLPRRELDQNLRAILQEEAAREMAARGAGSEPEQSSTPTDLGDTETEAQAGTTPEPAKGLDDEGLADIGPAPTSSSEDDGVFDAAAAAATAAERASRKDLFPDIEEINSTLDSHGPAEEFEEDVVVESRGGFSRAFFAIIFLAALALALYLMAPKLAESIPALEPALSGYVDAVNGARAWLDSLLQGVTDQIESAE